MTTTSDPSALIFVDTETFGLNPDRHMIWEVGCIVDNAEYLWQIKWPKPVIDDADPVALELNGYAKRSIQRNGHPPCPEGQDPTIETIALTPKERASGIIPWHDAALLTPAESVAVFAELAQGRHIVGAIPSFDEERLRRMHVNVLGHPGRFPWHYHLIDVEALAAGALCSPGANGMRHALDLPWDSNAISELIGVEPAEDRHTALGDARWARDIYFAVVAGL
jgi:hypothetical protein